MLHILYLTLKTTPRLFATISGNITTFRRKVHSVEPPYYVVGMDKYWKWLTLHRGFSSSPKIHRLVDAVLLTIHLY